MIGLSPTISAVGIDSFGHATFVLDHSDHSIYRSPNWTERRRRIERRHGGRRAERAASCECLGRDRRVLVQRPG